MYKVYLYNHGDYPQNGQVLLDTSSGTNEGLSAASVESRLNEPGSFTFTIVAEHPLYDSFEPLATYVSVMEDDNEIFYGRVLSVQNNPLTGTKQVTCEGALAFLLDAEVAIDQTEIQCTARQYFQRLLNRYNSEIGTDACRNMTAGTINVSGASANGTYKNSSASSKVQQIMKNRLLGDHDGFFKIERASDGSHTLSWVQQYGVTQPQRVEIALNVSSQQTTESGEDIFTCMRPLGKDQLTISNGSWGDLIPLSNEMVSKYGRITRTVNFSDVTDAATLKAKGLEYVNRLTDRLSLQGEIGFVDLHWLDDEETIVHLGDVLTSVTGYEGTKLTVESIVRDLLDPKNDRLTLKTDKDLLSSLANNGANSASSITGGSRGGLGGGAAAMYKFYSETADDAMITARIIELNATEAIALNTAAIKANADDIELVTADVQAQAGKWTNFEGSAFYQNREHIVSVTGKYSIDDQGNVKLVDGADFIISNEKDDGGAFIEQKVGTLLKQHDTRQAEIGQWIRTYEGTAIYQSKDHIAQVAGLYEVEDYVDPTDPTKQYHKLFIKEGTQLYQDADDGAFALYHEGNLSAGIVFNLLSNGRSQTKIYGDTVYIGNNAANQLSDWAASQDADMVTAKAAIQDLTASAITTDNLRSSIGSLNDIIAKSIIITDNGSLSTGGTISANTVSLSNIKIGSKTASTFLVSATVQDNVLTIVDIAGNETTFSKATTVEASGWGSSGKNTVTAYQKNGETRTAVGSVTISPPPNNDAELGAQVQGATWYVNITKADNTSQLLEVDLATAYAKAREGYSLGTYTLTTVTPEGTAYGDITPVSGNPIRLGANITPTKRTVTVVDSSSTAYLRDTTAYKTSKATGTNRGNVVYLKSHTTLETPTGTWYTFSTTETSLKYYMSGSEYEYITVASSVGENVNLYKANGTGVVATTSSKTYYDVGSTYAGVNLYPVVAKTDTAGTNYYTAGDKVTGLRNAGTAVTNKYYVKSNQE